MGGFELPGAPVAVILEITRKGVSNPVPWL